MESNHNQRLLSKFVLSAAHFSDFFFTVNRQFQKFPTFEANLASTICVWIFLASSFPNEFACKRKKQLMVCFLYWNYNLDNNQLNFRLYERHHDSKNPDDPNSIVGNPTCLKQYGQIPKLSSKVCFCKSWYHLPREPRFPRFLLIQKQGSYYISHYPFIEQLIGA